MGRLVIGGTGLTYEKSESNALADEIEARNSIDLLVDEGREATQVIDPGGFLITYAATFRKVDGPKWFRQRRDVVREFSKVRYPDSHVN